MKRITSFTRFILPLALFTGCVYPNQFRNVQTDAPHAVLVCHGVKVMHINDQRTSFWRVRERFRVPPGSTTLKTVAGHWDTQTYAVLPFTSEAGHTYSLKRQQTDGADRVVLRDDKERIVAQGEVIK